MVAFPRNTFIYFIIVSVASLLIVGAHFTNRVYIYVSIYVYRIYLNFYTNIIWLHLLNLQFVLNLHNFVSFLIRNQNTSPTGVLLKMIYLSVEFNRYISSSYPWRNSIINLNRSKHINSPFHTSSIHNFSYHLIMNSHITSWVAKRIFNLFLLHRTNLQTIHRRNLATLNFPLMCVYFVQIISNWDLRDCICYEIRFTYFISKKN